MKQSQMIIEKLKEIIEHLKIMVINGMKDTFDLSIWWDGEVFQLPPHASVFYKLESELKELESHLILEEQLKYDENYLNECIKKAKPNLSKIKDVDKTLNEIRGIDPEEQIIKGSKAEQPEEKGNWNGVCGDLKQHIINLLYTAQDIGVNRGTPNFDEWVDEQIKGIDDYFQSPSDQPEKSGMTAEEFICNDCKIDGKVPSWTELEKKNFGYDIYGVKRLLTEYASKYASNQSPLQEKEINAELKAKTREVTDVEIEEAFPCDLHKVITSKDCAIYQENKCKQEGAKALRDGKIQSK
jgi:hypothetical protein